ncbi:MAG: NHL repeat-containing protein, partial [Planctomycetota bacterium]
MKIKQILLLAFVAIVLIEVLPLVEVVNSNTNRVWANQFFVEFTLEGDIDRSLNVDFVDFATIAEFWQTKDCNAPLWCDGADYDQNHNVDINDIKVLAINWLGQRPGHLSFPEDYPTRIALVSDDTVCISDAHSGRVLIYNSSLEKVGQIVGLDLPLGVAADSNERIYVGNNGRDNVEVYNDLGIKLSTIGDGEISMPVDLTIDKQDKLYVADSLSDNIKVYDPNGAWLFNIGQTGSANGQFKFPSALAITYKQQPDGNEVAELYVADQANYRIQVFDLEGNFKRTFGEIQGENESWEGKFVKLQSLDFDAQGRLHVVDSCMNRVQILDPNDGSYIDFYGNYG